MRPKAISTFELLLVASVVLSFLNIFVFARGEESVGLIEASGPALTLVLGLVASRMRSNVVRWVLAVLVGLGVAVQVYVLATGGFGGSSVAGEAIGLLVSVLQIAAVAQLFRPEANAWFVQPDVVTAE